MLLSELDIKESREYGDLFSYFSENCVDSNGNSLLLYDFFNNFVIENIIIPFISTLYILVKTSNILFLNIYRSKSQRNNSYLRRGILETYPNIKPSKELLESLRQSSNIHIDDIKEILQESYELCKIIMKKIDNVIEEGDRDDITFYEDLLNKKFIQREKLEEEFRHSRKIVN
jgi:hypothetical protein